MFVESTRRPFACALTALALCASLGVAARAQGTVTGRVTVFGTEEPIASARIIALGTPSDAVTGQDGRFTLKHMAPGPVVLQVLRVGYGSQKRTVNVTAEQAARADFALVPTIVKLSEIVATGTGDQRRVEVGYTTADFGDIASRLERTPTILSVGDLLVQKAPSINVLGQGMVGTAQAIRIRGFTSMTQSNEPLFIVDGARIAAAATVPGNGVGGSQTSLLNALSPEEIESIEVLKGPAATSVYGTNAANGVVLITTKKGHVSDARWTWTAEHGNIKDNNDYPSTYAIWGHAPNSSTRVRCLLATMGPSTCLQDSVTSLNILDNAALSPIQTGRRNLYGMQVTGGTEVVRYYASGNVENAIGPLQMPGFAQERLDSLLVPIRGEWKYPNAWQRENFRANVNATLTPTLDMGVATSFIKSDQRMPQSDNSPIGIFAAARSSPGFDHAGLGYTNVGALGENLHGYNAWIPSEIFQDLSTESLQRETISLSTSWRPYAWMANNGNIGLDYANFTDFSVCRLNECPSYTSPSGAVLRNGQNYSGTTGSRVLTAKISSTGTWTPRPETNVKATIGTDYANVETDASYATGLGLPPGAQNVGQAATRTQATNITELVGKTLGVFVRADVAMHDRLFLGLGLRSDQNSAFGQQVLWVNYPSASVSWLASDETFFPKYSWLDQFRLRAAMGTSGQQPPLTASSKGFRPDTANFGGTDAPGLTANQTGSATLRPERTREIEGGFDARVLKGRVGLELTYYRRSTSNAIVASPIAPSAGAASLTTLSNVGSLESSGLEAVITTQLVQRSSFGWDLTLTASHGSNTVNDVGPSGAMTSLNTRIASGYPIDALFFRPYSYSDASGDGRIQASEVNVSPTATYAGYQVPRDLMSIQNGLDLFSRKLRVTALLDYKGGHSVYDAGAAYLCATYLSCPDESNPNASLSDQARSVANRYGTTVSGTNYTTGAGYLSNGGFWRLRELSATLTLPTQLSRTLLRANNASLNIGARNLKVWSSYKGVDPESNFGAGDLQTDFLTAAPPTYYVVRLNLHY